MNDFFPSTPFAVDEFAAINDRSKANARLAIAAINAMVNGANNRRV